jgi:hypothetical protein
VHEPAPTKLTVAEVAVVGVPTVQTPAVPLNVIGLPDPPPLATTVYVPPNVGVAGVEVIVTGCGEATTSTAALGADLDVQVR